MEEELRIVGVAEDDKGANTHYELTDGRALTREEAVQLHKNGQLQGYHIYLRNGVEYLRDDPDSSIEDNIDEQKSINP